MNEARRHLYELVAAWEEEGRSSTGDLFQYRAVLEEVLFQARLRFGDYSQFQNTQGEFPVRLKEWLTNTVSAKEKKALLKLLTHVLFIDRGQTLSLCRDAYRRVIVPWLRYGNKPDDLLAPNYQAGLLTELRSYPLFSITESFYFSDFRNVNNLIGLRKPTIFGDNPIHVDALLPTTAKKIKGLIVLEDIVGSGSQAFRILAEVSRLVPTHWRILFVPLIMLEEASRKLEPLESQSIHVRPVLQISEDDCLKSDPRTGEPTDFKLLRSLINKTATRVLEPLDIDDDPPLNPFGYNGCGALIVAYRNTPNNTLPLIHHQAPDWKPLFRRIHHARTSHEKRRGTKDTQPFS